MCYFCEEPDQFKIGVGLGYKMTFQQEIYTVCNKHVEPTLSRLSEQLFMTFLYPMVTDLDDNLIFHGYWDAEHIGISVVTGWKAVVKRMKD